MRQRCRSSVLNLLNNRNQFSNRSPQHRNRRCHPLFSSRNSLLNRFSSRSLDPYSRRNTLRPNRRDD